MKTIKRRRQEGKTDYSRRITMLKGDSPRLVFRKTNKFLIAQYVTSREAQDKIEFGVSSKKLINYGWPKEAEGSLKSIPASYCLGLLIGKIIEENKLKAPILDLGMYRVLPKTKIHSFIKGLVDGGVKLKHEGKLFPEDDKIKGKYLKNKIQFAEIKIKIDASKIKLTNKPKKAGEK